MPGPFPYRAGFGPTPAPACDVVVISAGQRSAVQGLIDTGASNSTIPKALVARMNLTKQGQARATGAYGGGGLVGLYVVDLEFLGLTFVNHPVWEADPDYVLIGRDILNLYTAMFHGPRREFDIT